MRFELLSLVTGTFLLIFFSCVSVQTARSQNTAVWNQKKAAVVLTYDDALVAQLDHAVPILDSLGLKATFYLTGYFPGFIEHVDKWKAVEANGHELGNHTLFHPCTGDRPGREWVQPEYDLTTYSVRQMADEIRMQNVVLQTMDGESTRTFAFPCGDTKAGDSSYVNRIKDDFIAARGVEEGMQKIGEIDLYNIDAHVINGQSGEELVGLAERAMDREALLVFLFHGVGGGHDLNVSLNAHRELLHFLKQNEKDIWVAPLAEVAGWVKEYNQTTR